MRIILRIGGSVIASPIDTNLIKKYADTLKSIKNSGNNLIVVVGGGSLAREFINAAKALELAESAQDEIAISVSRLFAQLFIKTLGKAACKTVPKTVEGAAKCLDTKKIVIMGGLKPGMTTDTVAALVAKRTNADTLVKGTDQDGIYDKDPRKHKDAIKLEHVGFDDLQFQFAEDEHRAGIHQIIDPEAVRIIRNERLRVVVVNGFKPENVLMAIRGDHIGTTIG